MDLSMLGQRQVTPGWENDPRRRNDGRKGREGRGMSRYPPPWADIGWRAEKGGVGIIRIAT